MFWGLRCVLVGFLLVTMVKKCKLWVLENIRKVYGDFWGGSMAFGVFFHFFGVILVLFGMFLTCFGVSVGFC